MVIKQLYEPEFCRRWEANYESGYRYDLEKALLARDIRYVFAKGDAGDDQFLEYVAATLRDCRSPAMLLEMAFCFDHFDEQDFYRFGGWKGVRLLCKLTDLQRKVVLPMLKGPGPYSYSQILHRLHVKKIMPPHRAGVGRPSHAVQEGKTRVLCEYIMTILKKHPELMPPESVRAAMPKDQRALLNSRVRHLSLAA